MPKPIVITTRDVTIPRHGLIVYTNNYWYCQDGDPTKALFAGDSPQCNKNKSIMDNQINNLHYKGFNPKVVHIPVAYVPERK